MKKIILCVLLSVIGLAAKAQYNYYNPYSYAVAQAETNETYQLNNIRFDENALMTNEEAWTAYNKYLSINTQYEKKNKVFNIVGWSGVGVACASLVPLCIGGNDTNEIIGYSMICAGTLAACVGFVGVAIQTGRMKANKKDFIYYLKATHNGIGIVSIF